MNNNDFDNIKIPDSLDSVIEKSFKRAKNDKCKFIKRILAATIGFGVFAGAGILSSPTLAEDFPFIESALNKLGVSKSYKDYTYYIGQEKELNGVKFKIEELVVTEHKILVGVLATSENKIDSKDYNININLANLGDIYSAGNSDSSYNINDNTVMYYHQFETGYTINPVCNITLDIIESVKDITSEEKTLDHVSFDIKIDETDRFSKTEFLTINNNDIDFNFKFSEIETYLNYKNSNDQSNEFISLKVLKVNNEYKPWLDASTDDYNGTTFNNIGYTKEEIQNAKSIDIISIGIKDRNENWTESNVPLTEKDNMLYIKNHQFSNGTNGEVVDIKRDDESIILKYKTDRQNIYNLMWNPTLYNYNEKTKEAYGIGNYPTIIDEGNDIFTFKYNNVPKNSKVMIGLNTPPVDIIEFKDKSLKVR